MEKDRTYKEKERKRERERDRDRPSIWLCASSVFSTSPLLRFSSLLSFFFSTSSPLWPPKVTPKWTNICQTRYFLHTTSQRGPKRSPREPQGPQRHHFGAFGCPFDDPGAPFWASFRPKYSKLNCIANLHFKLLWHWPLIHPHPQKQNETKTFNHNG